jgi:hypothetical protein
MPGSLLGLDLDSLLELVLFWLALLATLAVAVATPKRKCDYEKYERRIEELREELRAQREHYETVIRDLGIKSVMMQALWDAFSTGELQKCIKNGGNPRVLADGAVICDKQQDSYLIIGKIREGGEGGD